MSFPVYRSYRASGADWLGDVPAHWEITRLKRACDVFPSNVDKKTVEGQTEVRLCNYTDVYYNDVIRADLPFMEASATDAQIERFELRAGDTIFTKDSETPDDIARSAYVPFHLPGVICGYHLSMARPREGVSGAFIKRFFDGASTRAYFHVKANGLTRVGLGQYAVDNAPIALPPPSEQAAIAAFLDREAAKIDALVEEQRRLIELLKEKRQTVISHAVTKGLDPTVPMKDSGVAWLGEVPAHWDVVPLKYLCTFRSGGTPSKENRGFWDGEVPWASAKDLKSDVVLDTIDHLSEAAIAEGVAALIPAGSIVVLVRGMMLARTFPVCEVGVPLSINQDLKALLPKSGLNGSFLAWLLRGTSSETLNRLDEAGHGTKALRMETWVSMHLPRPPEEEQVRIVQFVEQIVGSIDALAREAERTISLLQERRAALISAAVTGKIDVQGAVSQQAEAA